MASLEVQNLSFTYPLGNSPVLQDVSFRVEKGEFCALIGGNGSGKSTLCYALRGFIPHFYKGTLQGKVEVEGRSVPECSIADLTTSVGIVIQNPFNQLSGVAETVYEEMAFGLENLGVERAEICRRVEEMLPLTGLDRYRDKNPYGLSGGQQQRLALASILVMEPDILVLDEPTSQVDPKSSEELFGIIDAFHKRGTTVFLVEHKMELVARFAEHVIVLDEGRVVLDGSAQEIFGGDDIENFPISLPAYNLLGRQLRQRKFAIDQLPVCREQADVLYGGLLGIGGTQ